MPALLRWNDRGVSLISSALRNQEIPKSVFEGRAGHYADASSIDGHGPSLPSSPCAFARGSCVLCAVDAIAPSAELL